MCIWAVQDDSWWDHFPSQRARVTVQHSGMWMGLHAALYWGCNGKLHYRSFVSVNVPISSLSAFLPFWPITASPFKWLISRFILKEHLVQTAQFLLTLVIPPVWRLWNGKLFLQKVKKSQKSHTYLLDLLDLLDDQEIQTQDSCPIHLIPIRLNLTTLFSIPPIIRAKFVS